MRGAVFVILFIVILPFLFFAQTSPGADRKKVAPAPQNMQPESFEGRQGSVPGPGETNEQGKAVENYEMEKLKGLKKNVGRRFMTTGAADGAEFHPNPDDLEGKFRAKNKEVFSISEVVQNAAGTRNYYKVKFESGKIGYLSADAYYLELRVREGSLLSLSKKPSSKKPAKGKKKKSSSPRQLAPRMQKG